MINDEECAHFLAELTVAYYHDLPHLILTFNESNWYLVMTGTEVVAEMRPESLHQYVDGDAKANFSLFSTSTAEGEKSPSSSLRKSKLTNAISNSGDTVHTILPFGIRRRDGSLSH
jgi:hypothetical protein